MTDLGPASDWLQLSEHYRQLSDDELIELSRESSQLTDAARQILGQEISQRRLTIPTEELTPPGIPPPSSSDSGDEYAEGRELVTISTVWSRADAIKLQTVLIDAGFPFYIGPEMAPSVDKVTSNFADGLDVQVMRIGASYASNALRQLYEPADEPAELKDQDNVDSGVHCPRCHSTDVTLEQLLANDSKESLPEAFQWTCNSCGNAWQDDGVET